MAYAELGDFKQYVIDPKVTSEPSDFDDTLEAILERSSALVDLYCRRPGPDGFRAIGSEPRTFDGDGTQRLAVGQIRSTTLLRVRRPGLDWEEVEDYVLRPASSRLPQGHPHRSLELTGVADVFPAGHDTVEVTGLWGWAAVPADVVQATLTIAVRIWRARGAGFSDVIGISAEPGDQLTFVKALTAETRMILDRYRPKMAFA